MKCPELSALPKAPKLSSLTFRRVTPGAITRVWSAGGLRPNKAIANDPKHPGNSLRTRDFPKVVVPNVLTIHAVPFALLGKPEIPPAAPFRNEYKAALSREQKVLTLSERPLSPSKSNVVPVSMLVTISNKESRGKPSIKRELGRRLKTALDLIMIRGADTKTENGQLTLLFDESKAIQGSKHRLLQDWTYVLQPTLEIYRMPYPDIVAMLNASLRTIWTKAKKLEESWSTTENTSSSEKSPSDSKRSARPKKRMAPCPPHLKDQD